MGKKPMVPMDVSERAKQFMPFKAVAGLDEALQRKRIEMGVIEEAFDENEQDEGTCRNIDFDSDNVCR